MVASEIGWLISVPVPCAHCGKEKFEAVSGLVDLTEITCDCGAVLDINTKEWAAFRNGLKELCVGKALPVAPVKKLPQR